MATVSIEDMFVCLLKMVEKRTGAGSLQTFDCANVQTNRESITTPTNGLCSTLLLTMELCFSFQLAYRVTIRITGFMPPACYTSIGVMARLG